MKQGCVLAPTLFSMMFSAMLTDAFNANTTGIDIRYRTDGKLYNSRRPRANTKVHTERLRDFLFADDCKSCIERTVTVNGVKLAAVDRFTCLGSTLSRNVHIDDETDGRIAKASAAFGRLRSSVWECKGVSQATKIKVLKVYRYVVLTTLLYDSKTWTFYQRHAKKLNRFHLCCLRKLLRVSWQDKVPDTEILEQSEMPSVFTLLQQTLLCWAGHVTRMSVERLPKRILY
ncbi:hypothetical protein ElyMa_003742800 [Elysia marginata]|uniref:Reverse transcriptase domain-containing protein n=1 Tax=Elysia marginata TaxID=1093978 RepID=A0AAV4F8M4_9GAST|nr:hypothetical protein ElyMa_003742800 [Elysia marginata]